MAAPVGLAPGADRTATFEPPLWEQRLPTRLPAGQSPFVRGRDLAIGERPYDGQVPPTGVGVVVGVLGGAVLTFVPQQVDGGADPPAAQAGAR